MALPDGFVEEIKYRNSIEDVISSYVTLKRAGSNLVGLCPFHNEKSPSFTVFPATRGFYCFGCGAGGDVITFVMKTENLDYMAALEVLAKRAGMTMPENERAEKPDGVPKNRILDMNRDAARYFHGMLSQPEGAEGLSYLRSRGLSNAAINHFGLGYAPAYGNSFLFHMRGLGYGDKELTEGFLCARSQKDGRLYPIFRNRVMFPVIDTTGNVAAFGGRVLDDSKPKYLNSSDTPAFKKTRTLYGLNFAKSACAESLILCEGYMDVIAVQAAGIPNAVATLGTSITPEHARMMARYTKEVIIAYDMDEAGRKAAEKAIRLLDSVGVTTKILHLNDAKDPDEYIRRFGADRFRLRLSDSENQFDYRCGAILASHDLEDFNGRMEAAAELTELLGTLHSEVERDVYAVRYAEKLNIRPESLKADARKSSRRKEKGEEQKRIDTEIRMRQGYGDRINPDRVKNPLAANAEETIIGILLLYPELVRQTAKGFDNSIGLGEEEFFTAFGRRVYAAVTDAVRRCGTVDMGTLGEDFDSDEMGRIMGMMVARQQLSQNDIAVIRESAEVLRRQMRLSTEDELEKINTLLTGKRTKKGNTV